MTEMKYIDPSTLEKNPENPRVLNVKSSEFKALAEDIKQNGVAVPIAIRTVGKKQRIIYGERRVQAAINAKLKEIPAIDYGKLGDAEALDLTLSENKDRHDLTPIEECRAVKFLMEQHGCEKTAASKLGISVYRARRAANAAKNLSQKWVKAIDNDKCKDVTMDHLSVLCRLPKSAQDEVLGSRCFKNWNNAIIPIKEFEQELGKITGLLKSAKWDFDDKTLDTKAGACSSCKKRASQEASLFGELGEEDGSILAKNDRCLDKKCWERKEKRWLARLVDTKKKEIPGLIFVTTDYIPYDKKDDYTQYGKISYLSEFAKAKKSDKGAFQVLIVHGKRVGSLVWVKRSSSRSNSKSDKKPETVEEKRAKLKTKRVTWASGKLNSMLSELYQDGNEIPKELKTEVKDIVHSSICAAIVFGCYGETHYKGDFEDLLNAGEIDDCRIFEALTDKLLNELSANRNPDENFARTVGKAFGIDFDELLKMAEKELPEPKSWTKEKKK